MAVPKNKFAFSRRGFMLLPLGLMACKPGPAAIEISGATMGTTYNVTAVDQAGKLGTSDLRQMVEAALAEVNSQMSNWDSTSEISRFNARRTTDAVSVSPELAYVMNAARDVHAASGGQFDVTVGTLIDLWGFGAGKGGEHMPSAAAIETALASAGQEKTLQIGAETLRKTRPAAEVYLSAIGKGYGVDRVARALQSAGLKDFMIEIGGDLYTAGVNGDGMRWRIGIETPDALDRGLQAVVGVSDLGMATSGDYRNYFEKDGARYSHIIDPGTGRPITHNTASATVLTGNAMLADAWATAMLIMGREKGMQVAEAQNLAVLFVERAEGSQTGFVTTKNARFTELMA
ncbi:ApbE-like lipoprotein [Nitratireductor pacificus pht-3B]|uniref:FAD:protein FMN transferase n=1 Tax=Nitratireductor pacificus pht-3B TaxID=391937 RepID=K2MKT0_9HYPH|nr:ApbE-like lipoprotein [Nitratireductor pacificus pht-3B]